MEKTARRHVKDATRRNSKNGKTRKYGTANGITADGRILQTATREASSDQSLRHTCVRFGHITSLCCGKGNRSTNPYGTPLVATEAKANNIIKSGEWPPPLCRLLPYTAKTGIATYPNSCLRQRPNVEQHLKKTGTAPGKDAVNTHVTANGKR